MVKYEELTGRLTEAEQLQKQGDLEGANEVLTVEYS